MATSENRSRYTVSVKHRDELCREFPFTELTRAKLYQSALSGQDYKPVLAQKENALLINITQTGHQPVRFNCKSLQEAPDAIARRDVADMPLRVG